MKKLIIILSAIALACIAGVAFMAMHLNDTLITERNQARTLPARMAKLNRVTNQEQVETPAPLNENHKDEESK